MSYAINIYVLNLHVALGCESSAVAVGSILSLHPDHVILPHAMAAAHHALLLACPLVIQLPFSAFIFFFLHLLLSVHWRNYDHCPSSSMNAERM